MTVAKVAAAEALETQERQWKWLYEKRQLFSLASDHSRWWNALSGDRMGDTGYSDDLCVQLYSSDQLQLISS